MKSISATTKRAILRICSFSGFHFFQRRNLFSRFGIFVARFQFVSRWTMFSVDLSTEKSGANDRFRYYRENDRQVRSWERFSAFNSCRVNFLRSERFSSRNLFSFFFSNSRTGFLIFLMVNLLEQFEIDKTFDVDYQMRKLDFHCRAIKTDVRKSFSSNENSSLLFLLVGLFLHLRFARILDRQRNASQSELKFFVNFESFSVSESMFHVQISAMISGKFLFVCFHSSSRCFQEKRNNFSLLIDFARWFRWKVRINRRKSLGNFILGVIDKRKI